MKRIVCKQLNLFLVSVLLLSTAVMGQTQTKRYSEKFNVDDDVEIAVNTSHSDLVFESWNRNQVEIEAIIEIEGVSEEEAEKIFRAWNFQAVGNSNKITVKTGNAIHGSRNDDMIIAFRSPNTDFDFNYEVEVPDVAAIMESLPEDFVMPPMPPMPPLPENFQNFDFDYQAYQKDGEAYLNEWKKQFKNNFDEEFIRQYEEWGKQVEELYKQHEKAAGKDKDRQKMIEEREKMMEEREKMKEEREKIREEIRKEQEMNRAETRIMMEKIREESRRANRAAREAMEVYKIRVAPGSDAKIFFYEQDGMPKNLKIKKTIKIKAPKGARLDLDVRYGEIKLAENYNTIHATLSYARLHAPMVEGKNTVINAAYSPMRVDYWKEGTLNVSYAKVLELERVQNIRLTSESSNVAMRELQGNAIINGSFGDLVIGKLSDNFSSLDLVLENSDASLTLPDTSFDFYARTTFSRMKTPGSLKLDVNEMQNSKQLKGYNKAKGSGKTIHIIANYSNLNLQGI
ncbi:hypothetical protein [Robertkochia flava]|uniref:hypothetical protein n=1 Tax=Robertkochia flava TaxID=3447986 RepID=UPI001CCC142A|nr:hypothetical protein [Robertkochia marina]